MRRKRRIREEKGRDNIHKGSPKKGESSELTLRVIFIGALREHPGCFNYCLGEYSDLLGFRYNTQMREPVLRVTPTVHDQVSHLDPHSRQTPHD